MTNIFLKKYLFRDDHPPWITDVNYYSTPSVREGGCRRCPYVGDRGHDNARVISEQRGRYVQNIENLIFFKKISLLFFPPILFS